MASHPPASCCTIGVKHEGNAVGEVKNIGDIRTYFSYPESKSTQDAVLILTDVIGMDSINAQLIADDLARAGYFVVMPDLFHGNPIKMNRSPDFDIMKWLQNHLPPVVDLIVEAVLKEMRGPLGCKRIGGVGYCFGGKYVCRFLKPGMLDAGFTAHPSFVEKEELKGCKGPLSIAAAETDTIFPAPKRHETEEILAGMSIPYQINLFSDVEHGFATRGDMTNRKKKFAKEQAFHQLLAWFEEYVRGMTDAPFKI
ncbi:alpha/beta-hydrolase [Delitschia confertaspora ATCC 74209]|uniref:Alpha/beta-hydrolase n=1 Tax=Delitschia confertaspora ATCC 74209 TaxID=1513339 RepID=A0A9P4JTW5_9PLEO|nr:alpha/beta-hydrolase [Delitschia confertaspora ATCC 74209]